MTDEPTDFATESIDAPATVADWEAEGGAVEPAVEDELAADEEAETPFGVVGDVPTDPADYDQAFQGSTPSNGSVSAAYESPAVADGSCPDCTAKLHPSSPEHCILCGWDAGSPPKGAVTTDMDLSAHILGKNEG